ncbi:alpha-amylase family protein [Mucilaginibacter arboris]|uniref:alpha-amylase family protein n=1 Tax=Mucilaginibacter arboris TaxID=2682090 RepID=UPI0018DCB2B9|nr:alpha-amylase family protein [Mucilaginibacter arboris]
MDVRTFKDSNGDGYGDFKGLTSKLDYLKNLGVEIIWLSPFQPSPLLDDGYDITNFFGIDPKCGTKKDFDEFMQQAKAHHVRVIMDMVLNHTSNQHQWFQQAENSDTSKYHFWYVWTKTRPKDYNKGMVFPGVQKEIWSLDPKLNEYYYHRFYKFQPDLNYDNPMVKAEAYHILGYWLKQGMDGFRLDAVPFIIEEMRPGAKNLGHDFDFITQMRHYVQAQKPDAFLLGEANVLPKENQDYFGKKGERMQMLFNFFANQHLFYALATGKLDEYKKALQETDNIPPASQWANFLRNHDEVDLGRLSNAQREQVYQKMGPQKNMQLYNRGIRRRLTTMLHNSLQLKMAYSLLFSLPGTPVMRYGDEIGMGDDLNLKERLSVRTPMQWSDEKNAGFTNAAKPFRPVISQGEYNYHLVNVATEQKEPKSLYNWMAKLIKIRKTCPEFSFGEWEIIPSGSPEILAIQYNYLGKTLITLHNFSNKSEQAMLSLSPKKLTDLLENNTNSTINGKFKTALNGYSFKWYRLN